MRKNKNSDENFTALFSAIDRQALVPDQEFLRQLRERSAGEFTAGAPDGSTNTPKSIRIAALGRIIMKSPLTRLAVAAAVIVACVIGLSLWRTTGSGIALADVLARVEKAKAVRYKSTVQSSKKVTGEDPNKPYNFGGHSTLLISREYGQKWDTEPDPNSGESRFEAYVLPAKRTLIFIWAKEKKYRRTEFDDRWAEQWQMKNDPATLVKRILKFKYESLGRSTIDGIEVEGFRITDPNYGISINRGESEIQADQKVWVDVKTRLPVRFDNAYILFYRAENKRKYEHHVAYDFQWDVPVSAADFEPVIPDDYTGMVVKTPAHITEETAIQGLKLCVELLGNYPESFWGPPMDLKGMRLAFEKSETPAALRLKEQIKGLTDEEMANKLVDFLMPIRGLGAFYMRLEWDKKDRAYYGKIVTPKDADKVLLRWKVSDNEYRVIFGDLHTETVSPERLAELEKALPK
jgi:hypothetical protein